MNFLRKLNLTQKLVVFNLLLFGPFMGFRVLRTAGDDKVYVAQALEMARDGHWFVQTLADQPDYYKGPLHLILVRLGIFLFGRSMWASLYMNLALLLVASIALGKLMQRFYPAKAPRPERTSWAVWIGGAFASSIGIYLHAFASQMEVELACAFSIAIYLLSRANEKRYEYLFWITAGFAGWFKSPLHSVFIGVAALLYWTFTGEILKRLGRQRTWIALGLGVLIGAAGYLPAFFMDRAVFTSAYLSRETFNKGASGEPWFSPVWPILSFFLIPWMFVAFVAYADGLTRVFREYRSQALGAGGRRLVLLGLVILLPCMLFFVWFPYRTQNYTLPAAGGWLLAIGAIWSTAGDCWNRVYRAALVVTGLILVAWGLGFVVVGAHFEKLPPQWPVWLLPFLVLGGVSTGILWFREGIRARKLFSPERLLFACLPFYLSFGALYAVLGEREMLDLNTFIAEKPRCLGQPLRVGYFNLQHKLWSEWGYLNFMVNYPVEGLHTEASLKTAIRSGELILVAEKSNLDVTLALAGREFPELEGEPKIWHRWRTQGRSPDGTPLWESAWDKRDLTVLEAEYWMVRFKARGKVAPPGCD